MRRRSRQSRIAKARCVLHKKRHCASSFQLDFLTDWFVDPHQIPTRSLDTLGLISVPASSRLYPGHASERYRHALQITHKTAATMLPSATQLLVDLAACLGIHLFLDFLCFQCEYSQREHSALRQTHHTDPASAKSIRLHTPDACCHTAPFAYSRSVTKRNSDDVLNPV
jgi:hypothetical protein